MILELYLAGFLFTAGHFMTRYFFESYGLPRQLSDLWTVALWPTLWPLYWVGFIVFDILGVEQP